MKSRRVVIALALLGASWRFLALLGAAACGDSGHPVSGDELGALRSPLVAPFSPGERAGLVRERQEAVRDFFRERLEAFDIVATTVTESGTVIDWIPESPTLFSPPPLVALPELPEGEEYAKSELDTQPWARGPKGTAGRVRFDVEGYLEEVGDDVPSDPQDALASDPFPSPDGTNRYHVEAARSGNNWGVEGMVSVHKGEIYPGSQSIGQFFVRNGGQSSGKQTVEAGWRQTTSLNGQPRLFIFFTTVNYGLGTPLAGVQEDWVQGYNEVVKGFVRWGNPSWIPGIVLENVTPPGSSGRVYLKINIVHGSSGDPWWIQVNNEWIGYYVDCHDDAGEAPCSSSNPPLMDALREKAEVVKAYGEVFSNNPGGPTVTDMGGGLHPGNAGTGLFWYMKYHPDGSQGGASWTPNGQFLSVVSQDADCYSGSSLMTNGLTYSGFNYGGGGIGDPGCD